MSPATDDDCRWPNGLRIFFRLNIRRRYCGGVAQLCAVISANPVDGGRMLCKIVDNFVLRTIGDGTFDPSGIFNDDDSCRDCKIKRRKQQNELNERNLKRKPLKLLIKIELGTLRPIRKYCLSLARKKVSKHKNTRGEDQNT